MVREFYQRPDSKLNQKPLSIKGEVLNAVKEATVETAAKTKLDVKIMAEAAVRMKDALNQYIRSSPHDDEMGNLSRLAALKFGEVLNEKGMQRPDVIAAFTVALEEHLPPHPASIPQAPRRNIIQDIPPEDAPHIDVE